MTIVERLDVGLSAARKVCECIVDFGLARQAQAGARDPKSELQEQVQALGHAPPTYRVVQSGGPAHARWFEVEVLIGGAGIGQGRGRSKRLAEQEAARVALDSRSFTALPGQLTRADAGERATRCHITREARDFFGPSIGVQSIDEASGTR